jgi:hypothetical protein
MLFTLVPEFFALSFQPLTNNFILLAAPLESGLLQFIDFDNAIKID